ncbi:hypothetical protein [Streptomyces sp. NPDC056056]|uniref:hypothetical protein n=1 Tax=Streptomyces sp. NPDC056056 TaxID=3345698 RepID=UPI0035DBD14B
MTLSHTTTAEAVPALLATIQELHALQQPLIDALQRIHGDMENARSGGDEWASEWTIQVWNELPLAVRAAGGDHDAAQELADAARTAAARQATPHACDNCDGIDPASCLNNRDRAARQTTGQAERDPRHALCGAECPTVGQPAEAHDTDEARPPRSRWLAEHYDPLAKEWVSGWAEDREGALERLEYARTHTPTWPDDGQPIQRRLVRETTTWTVEDER